MPTQAGFKIIHWFDKGYIVSRLVKAFPSMAMIATMNGLLKILYMQPKFIANMGEDELAEAGEGDSYFQQKSVQNAGLYKQKLNLLLKKNQHGCVKI